MRKSILSWIMSILMLLLMGLASPVLASRTTGAKIDDATITTKVKYELAKDVKLGTLKGIQVDTHNGEVTLTGKVQSRAQKQEAAVIAGNVKGVTGVDNMLSVVPKQ
jgi:hyperosmotically inducible protein